MSGNGVGDAEVGNDEAISSQFLTGGDNAQTLNTGEAGGLIFGGRGDDIINLGDGMDFVIYRYDGADKTDSAAYDGGDVINNFNLSKDILVLAHVGGNVHNNAAAFFDAIKGFRACLLTTMETLPVLYSSSLIARPRLKTSI